MCGIIAIVRRPNLDDPPASGDVLAEVVVAPASLESSAPPVDRLERAAAHLSAAADLLGGVPGVRALLGDPALVAGVVAALDRVEVLTARIEEELDDGDGPSTGSDLEALNAALIACKDAAWVLRNDVLATADAVADLAGPQAGVAALGVHLSVQQALSAVDRLEVRGRDSAGLHLLVSGHGLDLDDPGVADELASRSADPLFGSGSVRWVDDGILSFVYKAAAEIGELGDNTAVLREAIRGDRLLRRALAAEGAKAVVLGHTRWASIGIISQPNAHPLNAEEVGGGSGPYVTAVLNGDVDNFADLKATEGLAIPPEITTDAKVIPTLTSRRIAAGDDVVEAFRTTVNRLEGSVAIGVSVAAAPDDLLLALRGSGQALYIGLTDDAYVVASEPYGVVEVTSRYVRMDGDTQSDPNDPSTRGQLVRLRGALAGSIEGIERFAYNGAPLEVTEDDVATAQITTRDIDRGSFPHFLLKEISEAPGSFRKTLRGKLVSTEGGYDVVLGDDVVPASVRRALADGSIRRVLAIGQGTAAVASQAFVAMLDAMVPRGHLVVEATLATELSGFALDADMSDTLVVAVSQSGTTTDTNRTVDLVRARGGSVIAIVNRRGSDLTDRSDGVLYTSDGRDVEMSVASTKAFYSQIAAGILLAVEVADLATGHLPEDPALAERRAERAAVLAALHELPVLMERTLELRPTIADAAHRFAPSKRYWAIVGNGANRIAAREIRIKLSELCYKSIASDGTEDKKHIDLSSEPLILVCAAGLQGSTADDVAKEVAIYRAHKATPIVVASEGEERFDAAVHAVFVPGTHPSLAFVLSTVVGHLFGYEAALAIDAQAKPLREARAAIESAIAHGGVSGEDLLAQLQPLLEPLSRRFSDMLRSGELNGHLEAGTAVELASLFRYATGVVPLDSFQVEHGRVGTPAVVVEELTDALTAAIEELTRPVDAIKHQAKTVTVGISRSDETLLAVRLVREVLAAGVARDRLSYRSLRDLGALEPLVDEVLGYTRYRVDGRVGGPDEANLHVIDRGGLGRDLRSRTETQPLLRGTKRRVSAEREVLLARGAADGRTVLIVPEVKDNQTTGLTLMHVTLRDDLGQIALRSVLQGYRDRYTALCDAVLETEPSFRDDVLTTIDVTELMTAPIHDVAAHWRTDPRSA